jgi:hypothetical protein
VPRIAIKGLKPELATEEFSRHFLHEAQMMAKVWHPKVAVVHDSDEREGLLAESLGGLCAALVLRRRSGCLPP